jgi:hypothetical protein
VALSEEYVANAATISEHFDMIIMCDPLKFSDRQEPYDTKSVYKVLEWCSFYLSVTHRVKFYPPLSVLTFLLNKATQRDVILRDLRLPTVRIKVGRTWKGTMKTINQAFTETGYRYDPSSGYVGKPLIGACADGVFHIKMLNETGRFQARSMLDSRQPYVIGKDIPRGTMISVEPYTSELKTEELRIFCAPYSQGKSLTELFTCKTELTNNGEIHYKVGSFATLIGYPVYKAKMANTLKAEVYSKMVAEFSAQMVRHLIFRLDMFIGVDSDGKQKEFLNEVDIFPAADPFLTDGKEDLEYILLLARATYSYILENINCWPA